MPGDEADLHSERGKEILAYATSRDYCVLEFDRREGDGMVVRVITDHVRELENMIDDAGP